VVSKHHDSPFAIRVGLVGAGNFAQDVLIPALKATKRASLRGVVTASGLSARSVAERFGFDYAASDPAEIFNDPDVDAVIIATRHDTHAPLVIEAIKAGKPVFVEKPLALSLEQLHELVGVYRDLVQGGAGEQGNKGIGEQVGTEETSSSSTYLFPYQLIPLSTDIPSVVMVGYNRRFAPATRAVKDFFAECPEPLAIHIRVNAGYLPLDHWLHDPEVGGGRILGEGCHFVDLLIYLAGSEPVGVYAQALPDDGRYRQDNVAVQICFANGAIGTLHYLANGDKRLGKERIEVFGGGAVAVIDDFRRVILSRNGKTRRIGRWWSRQDKGHRAEMVAFLEAIRTGGPSPIPFDQAVLSTLVTFKVLESLHTGKPVSITGLQLPDSDSLESEPSVSSM
jgi:predicted dehydrogenase